MLTTVPPCRTTTYDYIDVVSSVISISRIGRSVRNMSRRQLSLRATWLSWRRGSWELAVVGSLLC